MLGKASLGRCKLRGGKQEQSLSSQLESPLVFFGLREAAPPRQVKLIGLDVHICDPLEFIFAACQSPLLINRWFTSSSALFLHPLSVCALYLCPRTNACFISFICHIMQRNLLDSLVECITSVNCAIPPNLC